MDKITPRLIQILACYALICSVAAAQAPPKELSPRWDSLNQRLIYHRVSVNPPYGAIYTADAQGQETTSIDVLKDFPGSRHAVIQGVEGGPNGSIVATCILQYDTRPLKELILTYNHDGVLSQIIDIYPYESPALAVDGQGNIYSFGARTDLDPDDPKSVYPTVVKYSPQGAVLATMLPSSDFPPGEDPTEFNSVLGDPLIRVTETGIAVFSASTSSYFLLSPEGKILARADLGGITHKLAEQYDFKRGFVLNSFLDEKGDLVFRVGMDDGKPAKNAPPPAPGRFREPLIKLNPPTASVTELKGDMRQGQSRVIGVDRSGQIVYAYPEPDGSIHVAKE